MRGVVRRLGGGKSTVQSPRERRLPSGNAQAPGVTVWIW